MQEAAGTVLRYAFHEDETFGFGRSHGVAPTSPPPDHPCWQRGWVVLDRLPRYVEVQMDDCTIDYTGLGKPGVWHLEPEADDWILKYKY